MTEKQPGGQEVRRYTYRATSSVSRTVIRRPEPRHPGQRRAEREREMQRARPEQVETRKRTVTTPIKAVPPQTASERYQRTRRLHREQPASVKLVARSFEQTGRHGPVGPLRASRSLRSSKPLQRSPASSPIPVRSGQSRRGGSLLRRFLAFFGLLVVVISSIIFALVSPVFHVQHVQIGGTHNPALVASIQHMGIQGQNIFLLNQSNLVARLEALPLISAASLGLQMPDSLTINVQERLPVLLWQSGKTTFGVAQDGMIIAPLNQLSGTDNLPVVIDKRTSQARAGQHLSSVDVAFVEQIVEQLSEIGNTTTLSLEYIDRIVEGKQTLPANQAGRGSYVIASTQGWVAYLGDSQSSTPLADRLLELRQILSIARDQHYTLSTIDLRFGLRPTYTLKS